MRESLVLTYWEITRIRRSWISLAAAVAVPVIAVIASLLLPGAAKTARRGFFPILAVGFSFLIIHARTHSDHISGYADGLDTTPAVGGVVLGARVMTGAFLAGVESGLFYLLITIIG
jgi:hypothetical protein